MTGKGNSCAGIFKQSMGARNRVGIGLTYPPAGLHSLAEPEFLKFQEPKNRFQGINRDDTSDRIMIFR
jgi:hypothetical protein